MKTIVTSPESVHISLHACRMTNGAYTLKTLSVNKQFDLVLQKLAVCWGTYFPIFGFIIFQQVCSVFNKNP